MKKEDLVCIIPFSQDLAAPIKTLNLQWLQRYFKVEPKDDIVLSNPQTEIIDKGGMIFYAQINDVIIGTVSLLKINDSCYELSKMAVSDAYQGLGIGKKLLLHCFAVAEKQKIEKLILYSNRKLKLAIHLYEKFGFFEIPLEKGIYERADIKMEKSIA